MKRIEVTYVVTVYEDETIKTRKTFEKIDDAVGFCIKEREKKGKNEATR